MTATEATDRAVARLLDPARHGCVRCRELPVRPFDPADVEDGVEYRPKDPRPTVAGGPRSRVCRTHERAKRKATKASQAAKRSRQRSGVDEETRQAVKALQGDRCPCGAPLLPRSGRRLEPDADHDHDLAAGHDHPEEVACPECFRGFLCRGCNRETVGRLFGGGRDTAHVIAALRNLADYLENPPMRRLLAERPELKEAV